jgi:alpha-glucosidase (family GH31 glycosyl hydrolase)
VAPPEKVQASINISELDATLESSQLIVSVTYQPFGIVITDPKGQMLWELAKNGLARSLVLQKILAIPLLYTGNTIKFKWRLADRPIAGFKAIRQESGSLIVEFDAFKLELGLHNAQTLRMRVVPNRPAPRLNLFPPALSVSFITWPDSHFLGFGQRFNRVDQRGEQIYFLVEEGGVGYARLAPLLKHIFGERGSFPNGEQCTGFPVPFGLFSRETGSTSGLFWNTYQPSWIELPDYNSSPAVQSPQPKSARLTVLDQHLDLFLCAGPEPMDAIRQYTCLTGQPNLPPAWLLLPWKTQTGAVVEGDVLEDIQRFRELEIPLAQVGVEHWQNIRGSYEFSPEWFPNMQQLVDTAHDQGYRIHIWHFPYMNAGAATHLEGVRRGYFIKNRLGLPYQQRIFHGAATVLDYSNPLASSWHASLVSERFHRVGFDAVMTDYGESIPPDSVFNNGRSGLEMRNAYPLLYCQAMQGAAQAVLGDDYAIYPRAGYAGSQRYVTVQWPGDQDTDWDDGDGLPAAVRAMLNVSMCGFPVHGSDVGGWYDWFAPITTKELYLRWAEVGAYSPLMRAHGGPIGRNREPWKFDRETVAIYRQLSEEHVRLFPYLYSLSQQAAQDGTPVIRHPSLMWPAYQELYAVEDSWCIGEALYVAPVIRPGQTRRTVLLPPGEWWHLSQNRPVGQQERVTQLDVAAPFGQTPVFLRRGCLLPRFQRAFDTFDPVDTARVGRLTDNLEIWLYPGQEEAVFTLFDGTCLTYSQGAGQAEGGPQRMVDWKIYGEG